jgi:hypothetical protein
MTWLKRIAVSDHGSAIMSFRAEEMEIQNTKPCLKFLLLLKINVLALDK